MRKHIIIAIYFCLSITGLTAQNFTLDASLFDPPYLKKMIEPDAFFKPLSPPIFVAIQDFAKKSVPDFLSDDDWCIVIDHEATTRIYPIPVMIWHEVANEPAGKNQPMCVSYCILTGTALVFDPQFSGIPKLDFGVSGYLYQSNLVMFDYQSRSLWSQAGLRANSGKLKAKAIAPLSYRFVRWSQLKNFVDAQVCLGSTQNPAVWSQYAKAPMESLENYPINEAIRAPVNPKALADNQHPKKELFIYFPSKNIAVSFKSLARTEQTGISVDRVDGKLVSISSVEPFITLYWFALRAFYPNAIIK